MKYLILTFSLLLPIGTSVAGVQWGSYPTTNGMGNTDTILVGNGATNLTITAADLGTSRIQPIVNTTSNTLNTSINTASNSVFGSALTQINTTSNSLQGQITSGGITAANLTAALAAGTNAVSLTNATSATLPRSAADSTWASATNYASITNVMVGALGQVLVPTTKTNAFGSPTATWTNLLMGNLEYHVATNAFTNIIVGYIGPLTNYDGLKFYIPIGTNAP